MDKKVHSTASVAELSLLFPCAVSTACEGELSLSSRADGGQHRLCRGRQTC